MPLDQTLKKIDQEIAASDYGKARERLHGLLSTYPDDLMLRRKLGEVYWKLHYIQRAGCYWYLEEEKTPEMLSACRSFERACGHDPLKILLALKFRGNVDAIQGEFAGRTLLGLHEQARRTHRNYVDFRHKGAEKYHQPGQARDRASRYAGRLWLIGCGVIILLVLALAAFGALSLFRWIF